MSSVQEPEVQFAQRLASNERPVRTKALRKLRKYINVRSQKATGGFTGDELLKLWKGLFYCLWMQDKLLLQEELSNKISSLIHSFQDVDGQILYLQGFLQTFKREWTGIDRLRMDKFYQLVRFMFRQTFEMLKRKNWESSVVSRFLELLTAQLLQSSSEAPSGLQFHILDLYMTELAAVGSAELTAEQNLKFIEPFCKTAAKTKDHTLFSAICSSIFSTIIDQAPFAIEDLMKELKAAEASDSDSDSGQASEEDDKDLGEKSRKLDDKKGMGKQINGNELNEEEEEDELLHLEDSDTEAPGDDGIGPVLQFDYGALADMLFELSSQSSTPGKSRQRLYKITKALRSLSRGLFPRDDYPEEVSTDEDDDMFCSRKRMKRRGGRMEKDEEGAPASKKRKGNKKEASALNKQNKDSAKDEGKPADLTANNEKKKKKKRKKKKKKASEAGENAERSEMEQVVAQSTVKETDDQTQSSVSSVRVTEAATPGGQSETLLLSEVKKQPSVTVTEEPSDPSPGTTDSKELPEFKKKTSELKLAEEQETSRTEPEMSSNADATVSGKKKKKKKVPTDGIVVESQVSAEAEDAPPESDTTTTGKKKKKTDKNADKNLEEVNGVSAEDGSAAVLQTDSTTTGKKKSKKKNLKADEAAEYEVGGKHTDPDITSVGEELSPDAMAVPLVKKKKNKREETALQASHAADESTETPLKKKKKKNQEEPKTTVNQDGAESEAPQDVEKPLISTTTPAKKKKKKPSSAKDDEVVEQTQVQVVGTEDAELPLDETGKPAKRKKKRKIPVVFEYEADELQAGASINGLAEEGVVEKLDAGEPSAPLSSKKSQKKAKTSGSASDFISFLNDAAVPTPLFCKTKGSPRTPLSSKKKRRTPKSESKKVTFGLKNNKTAEFKKTDRSLLVSPDGSSRVPFDPKQKPKFGVLKSPSTPLSAKIKKTPKKVGPKTPKSTPKRRPSAADFF